MAGKSKGQVRVRGAREHNLQNIDVDIPRDALVVFAGISGSGKSSLAFGTIYAEAQRRYFESVTPYARRLIDQVGVPEVDSIDGLPPAVALQQRRGSPGARSSVGSITSISSLLRMLYSRTGSYPARQPMLFAEDFSPNTPQGACPNCHGLGRVYDVSERSMVPDDGLTIRERAIASWPPAWHGQNLRDILVTLGIDVDKPWRELPRKTRDWILFTEEQPTAPVYAGFTPKETRAAVRAKMEPSYQGTFIGARKYVLQTFANTQSPLMKRRVARFLAGVDCPVCHGKRLKPEALAVTFCGHDIAEISELPLRVLAQVLAPAARGEFMPSASTATRSRAASSADARHRVASGGASHAASPDVRRTPELSEEKRIAAQRLATDICERARALDALGLGYLGLDRAAPTLSPGELQRLRLATQMRSNLFGVVYVLDEPSAGLHPSDAQALLAAMEALKNSGNSVFVVEHDLQTMRHADWIVDVGPDAGQHGGRVLYSGPVAGLRDVKASHTARYLFGPSALARPRQPREAQGWLRLEGIVRNNLRGVDASFPLGALTSVTGVSGSGKSSLVSQALVELVCVALGGVPEEDPAPVDEENPLPASAVQPMEGRLVEGAQAIKRLVRVDQKPIGRTPRSNLATYTGLFDHIRKIFAATPLSRKRRYGAGRFSFNTPQGRCATCDGEGFVSVELLFMPSVYAPCPSCHGARYDPQTLEVVYRGKSIAQVLDLTVEDAAGFFGDVPAVLRPLTLLREIGLGYLRLGQPATELSGGEAQRIKLATELQRMQRGGTLYVLDEPTTGLHPADVDKLLVQLHGLVDAGNTVVVVEHDMRVVATSDWVIDVGPGAGDEGGQIVFSGTPAELAGVKASKTAPHLSAALSGL
jgi:excinuclease ABC subunit A